MSIVKSIAGTVKGVGNDILESLLPLLKPFFRDAIKEFLLERLYEKDPNIHKVVLTSLYGPVDVVAETEAAKTETKYDDFAVACVKEALEASAGAHNVELPNLDED